ncbi:MAG: thiazole synthase [Acidobacteriota bacterium]|nr:thiazole synthase [Acidobacteriota bacterium]
MSNDELIIAGRSFGSRLITGTGKYASFAQMAEAIEAAGSKMVTVAVRRVDFDDRVGDITSFLPDDVLLLPNTSGAETAEEAVRIARLARAGGLPTWIKLEVIPDARNLLPDPLETLRAAEVLVADGFTVLPYMFPDPLLARRLEGAGCATVMPLAAPIGSGRGLKLREAIGLILEEASVPVVIDAGLGAPSEAAAAMELGADAVLVNTAIAKAADPVAMAGAFRQAVAAGRQGFLAGLMDERSRAEASSPVAGAVAGA